LDSDSLLQVAWWVAVSFMHIQVPSWCRGWSDSHVCLHKVFFQSPSKWKLSLYCGTNGCDFLYL
jgi:hypothetical protein